jgi:ABC-2 type transport system ATP-binding protein
MQRLGQKEMRIELADPPDSIPDGLADFDLTLDGNCLIYRYDTRGERTGITRLLHDIQEAGLQLTDVQTSQSSLEDIFVDLVQREDAA